MLSNMNKLENLQILRALAASLVVFGHAVGTYYEKVGPNLTGYHFSLDHMGDFGVKLFFCISGFIIFKSAASLDKGIFSAIDFSVRRIIRIVPIYWIATCIYALKLSLTGTVITAKVLILSLFFIPYINSEGIPHPILGVGWTLNYEMFFYFILALSVLFIDKVRILFITSTILIFLIAFNSSSKSEVSDIGYTLLATHYLLFFLLGMGLAKFSDKFVTNLSPHNSIILISLATSLIFLTLFLLNTLELNPTKIILIELVSAFLIVLITVLPTRPLTKSLGSTIQQLLVKAGDASYSTYLFHGFIMGVSGRIVYHITFLHNPYLFASLMLIVCTTGGYFVYRLIESPIIITLNSQWKKIKS